ncbi:hypothetical protein ABT202_31020 [Streptomyces sp900105245]|uniref:hypothetical protein n=1 Tax=Streptomyces sp. 900105245 TaxID=3154379 RepID=UPI00332C3083
MIDEAKLNCSPHARDGPNARAAAVIYRHCSPHAGDGPGDLIAWYPDYYCSPHARG